MAAIRASKEAGYREKIAAYEYVRKALREGTLKRPETCSVCGVSGNIVQHHPNYARPLHVRWVCQSCHQKIHAGALPDFEVQWYLGGMRNGCNN
jgi:transposase-like protein